MLGPCQLLIEAKCNNKVVATDSLSVLFKTCFHISKYTMYVEAHQMLFKKK